MKTVEHEELFTVCSV